MPLGRRLLCFDKSLQRVPKSGQDPQMRVMFLGERLTGERINHNELALACPGPTAPASATQAERMKEQRSMSRLQTAHRVRRCPVKKAVVVYPPRRPAECSTIS